MTAGMTALLAGLFLAPAALLWLGQRFRQRTPRWRRVFWGAVTGHTLGMLATVGAAHYPPVSWGGGPPAREVVLFWSMPAGALAGAAVAWLLAGRRG